MAQGIGVFQSFYQENYLSGYSPITISWIASLELAILFGGVSIYKNVGIYSMQKFIS